MAMSNGDPAHGSTTPPRRERTWPLFSAAVALVLIAWLIVRYPPIPRAFSLDEVSATYSLMAAGALPWFLQWAGVTCGILGCCGSRNSPRAALFAILFSFTLAAIWWSGIAFTFWGMDPLEAILHLTAIDVRSRFGGSAFFDFSLFGFIGPILGPFQLYGPLDLHGWNFLFVMLSTTFVVGYPLIVCRLCRIDRRSLSVSDYVKWVAGMLPCFLPPFIRLGIQIAQIG